MQGLHRIYLFLGLVLAKEPDCLFDPPLSLDCDKWGRQTQGLHGQQWTSRSITRTHTFRSLPFL